MTVGVVDGVVEGVVPGVTDGELLRGVRFFGGGARTHTLMMSYQGGLVRFIDTVHMWDPGNPPKVRL